MTRGFRCVIPGRKEQTGTGQNGVFAVIEENGGKIKSNNKQMSGKGSGECGRRWMWSEREREYIFPAKININVQLRERVPPILRKRLK